MKLISVCVTILLWCSVQLSGQDIQWIEGGENWNIYKTLLVDSDEKGSFVIASGKGMHVEHRLDYIPNEGGEFEQIFLSKKTEEDLNLYSAQFISIDGKKYVKRYSYKKGVSTHYYLPVLLNPLRVEAKPVLQFQSESFRDKLFFNVAQCETCDKRLEVIREDESSGEARFRVMVYDPNLELLWEQSLKFEASKKKSASLYAHLEEDGNVLIELRTESKVNGAHCLENRVFVVLQEGVIELPIEQNDGRVVGLSASINENKVFVISDLDKGDKDFDLRQLSVENGSYQVGSFRVNPSVLGVQIFELDGSFVASATHEFEEKQFKFRKLTYDVRYSFDEDFVIGNNRVGLLVDKSFNKAIALKDSPSHVKYELGTIILSYNMDSNEFEECGEFDYEGLHYVGNSNHKSYLRGTLWSYDESSETLHMLAKKDNLGMDEGKHMNTVGFQLDFKTKESTIFDYNLEGIDPDCFVYPSMSLSEEGKFMLFAWKGRNYQLGRIDLK